MLFYSLMKHSLWGVSVCISLRQARIGSPKIIELPQQAPSSVWPAKENCRMIYFIDGSVISSCGHLIIRHEGTVRALCCLVAAKKVMHNICLVHYCIKQTTFAGTMYYWWEVRLQWFLALLEILLFTPSEAGSTKPILKPGKIHTIDAYYWPTSFLYCVSCLRPLRIFPNTQ